MKKTSIIPRLNHALTKCAYSYRDSRLKIEPVLMPGLNNSKGRGEFFIYRGDTECELAPGNKRHKLKHHLTQAELENSHVLATFGGPHSNHIDAFSAKVAELGKQAIIIVRGELHAHLTPTLRAAVDRGAILFPSTRMDYRLGLQSEVKSLVDSLYKSVYWIPEGGSGALGVLGCRDWVDEILKDFSCDMVCVSSGTGTTAAGFLSSDKTPALGVFSALKGTVDLGKTIRDQCVLLTVNTPILTFDDVFHGGFGKFSDELFEFLSEMYRLNPTLKFDPVYTGKMAYHVYQLYQHGNWPYGRTLFIHTGGLQGWKGIAKRNWPYENIND